MSYFDRIARLPAEHEQLQDDYVRLMEENTSIKIQLRWEIKRRVELQAAVDEFCEHVEECDKWDSDSVIQNLFNLRSKK